MIYRFEGHSLDAARRELRCGDQLVDLEPQVFDLLHYLLRHRGRVVSKDELIADIWNGRVVSDSTLSSRISALRRAVGDSGERQALIRTMARKGLRFVGPVHEDEDGPAPIAVAPAAAATAATAAPIAPAPNPGGRRQLTILACSLVDALALSSRLDPEALRELMAAYRAGVAGVAAAHAGHIAHDTGDGLVIHFGFPAAAEDDAERAVRAALALLRATAALATGSSGRALQSRVGIATGPVVIGPVMSGPVVISAGISGPAANSPVMNANGDADAAAGRAAVGATPLRAAQLLAAAPPGGVFVCATTRELVGALFEARSVAPSAGVNGAWQVLAEAAVDSRFEALRRSSRPLLGRDEELALLLRRWQQVGSGAGRVVLVCGEAGIGKSRLVAGLREALADSQPACWRYACAPHRQQTALYPVVVQLEHRAGFTREDDDRTRLQKLERMLAPAPALALPTAQLARDAALLADLLGVAAAPALALSAQRRRELLLDCLLEQVVAEAARAPLLLILEDVHWIDPTTRELFDRIVERLRSLPVLLVMTYRPEFAAPWVGQSHVTLLALNRLDARDNAELVRQVAAGRTLAPGLVEQIVARSDGVPLFVEELTKAVLEGGALAVPATLQASLVARFDRLSAARTLVQTCAALGREFSYALVRAVTNLPDAELEPLLGQLVAAELVHQRGVPPHAVYVFKHALVQDAAYETLLLAQRKDVHRRIVEVCESAFPEFAQRHPEVLAHHGAAAGLWEQAIEARIQAARMARERCAGVEAQAQVEQGFALLANLAPGDARRRLEWRLHVALGEAFVMTRGFAAPDVQASFAMARELLDPAEHPLEALGALCGLFNFHLIRSESPECLQLAKQYLAGEPAGAAAVVAHYLVGTAHLHLGDFAAAIEHLERALAQYDEEACRPVAFIAGYHLKSFILIWFGLALLYRGELRRATATIAAAVNDARGRAHPFTLVSALLALARFRSHTADLAGAVEATEEAAVIAAEQRSPYHQSRAAILRAVNLVDAGQGAAAIAQMESALVAHRATGANFQSSYNLSRLAEAHALAGHLAQACELAAQAVAEVERTGERWWEAEAHRIRGELLRAAGQDREALASLERALACARRQQARLWELRAALSLAQTGPMKEREMRTRTVLQPLLAHFTDGVDLAELQQARQLIAQAARSRPATVRRP